MPHVHRQYVTPFTMRSESHSVHANQRQPIYLLCTCSPDRLIQR